MSAASVLDQLQQAFTPADGEPDGAVRSQGVQHGVLVLALDREALLPTVRRLKDDFGFDLLLDVTAVDWPDAPLRFQVVHHLYSTTHHVRVRCVTRVSADDAHVDSLTTLFGSAAFAERECHEMYGVGFRGNTDLRPILLYEGFVGHPLRKDYPKQLEQPLVPYRPPQTSSVR